MQYLTCNFYHSLKRASDLIKGTAIQSIYNKKYIIASTQVTTTRLFTFIAVLIFKLVSRKFCLQTEKTETVKK